MVPEELVLAYPIVGVFLGDVLKRLGFSGWILPVNMLVGGILACSMDYWDIMTFIYGMELGAAATGLHGIRKKIQGGKSA